MKNEFHSKPIWKINILKTKIKFSGDEAIDFHDTEITKVASNYTCLAVILIDFVLKKDEHYYPQVFFKKMQIQKKKKEKFRKKKKYD